MQAINLRSSKTSHDEWCLKLKSDFPTCHVQSYTYYIPSFFAIFYWFLRVYMEPTHCFVQSNFIILKSILTRDQFSLIALTTAIVTQFYVISNNTNCDAVRMGGVTKLMPQDKLDFFKLSSKEKISKFNVSSNTMNSFSSYVQMRIK